MVSWWIGLFHGIYMRSVDIGIPLSFTLISGVLKIIANFNKLQLNSVCNSKFLLAVAVYMCNSMLLLIRLHFLVIGHFHSSILQWFCCLDDDVEVVTLLHYSYTPKIHFYRAIRIYTFGRGRISTVPHLRVYVCVCVHCCCCLPLPANLNNERHVFFTG